LHNTATSALQTINYAYNIRSWLTNINDVSALRDDMFALSLGYTTGDNPQFNGNIASMQWTTVQFGVNTYNFDYDGANRISEAEFTGTGSHNTSYTYDKNGNIMGLTREGRYGESTSYGDIDDLTYSYSGNQLQSVHDLTDYMHQNNGFTDDGSFVDTEYQYDANGNMTQDLNKTLLLTKYNHLNLPVKISIFDEFLNDILYLYSASGQKLRKATHRNYKNTNNTDYCGSFIYQDGQLQTILTPEGRMVVYGNSYEYQYFLKDHLGNTRITFNENKKFIQEDSYYPYGMTMSGLSHESGTDLPNKYLYNGKELQDDFGLGWYDYGARFYDPTAVHWTSPDLMAESYYAWSPYNYVRGNPITRFDPNGMWDDEFNDRSRDWVEAANGNIYWDDNATSQESTKSGEKYLGKNVLVGTHNRDQNGNEEINSARFDLYLEADKTGSSATIYGNTVPGDITKYGTLAEGLFSARFQGRASKIAKGIDDLALIINEGNDLPTTNGNPNKANSDMLSEVFFHAGNYGSERLTYATKDGGVGYISKGCQTSGCGAETRPIHNSFMGNVGRNFNGFYYLRTKPNPFAMPAFVMPIDNTYVAPIFHINL